MSQTDVKYFTPQEAKRTLPLVRQIVQDILNSALQMKIIAESFREEVEENEELQNLGRLIEKYTGELEEIGCSYKDWNFETGLIDFPSIIDGKDVLLCWRSDEEDILYYHGLLEGFAGRKLIPEKYL